MKKKLAGIASFTLLLAACGDDEKPGELTGAFRAGGAAGVHYATSTRSGMTDAAGTFRYLPGETVFFSIGGIKLGSAPGAAEITPFTLAGLAPPATERDLRRELDRASRVATPLGRAINIEALLIALDRDHDPANGLDVSGRGDELLGLNIDVSLPVRQFATSLQRRVPDLTVNVPAGFPLVHLYRALNIRVPAHADTSAETRYPDSTIVEVSTNSYGADGSHAGQSIDSNNDGTAEFQAAWSFDPLGRVDSITQDFSNFLGGIDQRYIDYQYDARGARTGVVQDSRYSFFGGPAFRSIDVIEITPDAHGFALVQILDSDVGGDGSADSRRTSTSDYDARHNLVGEVIESDLGLDGNVDETITTSYAFDNLDRQTYFLLEITHADPRIADSRQEVWIDHTSNPGTVLDTGTFDYNADGVIDARHLYTTTYEPSNRTRTTVQERDDNADGVVDWRYRVVSTLDADQRLLTQESTSDYEGDGVPDAMHRASFVYDDTGSMLRSEINQFSGEGELQLSSVVAYEYGPDGELSGSATRVLYSGGPVDGAPLKSTTVTHDVMPDGVLFLAQHYFEGLGAAAAYTDSLGPVSPPFIEVGGVIGREWPLLPPLSGQTY